MIEFEKYIQFEKLNNNDVISLYTKRPFNFSKNNLNIDNDYKELSNLINITNYKNPIQTHTNIVKCVTNDNINDDFNEVDGLITNIKGLALTTKTADCQAILLYDKGNKVIGNIHSGWKGTLNKILRNAINLMISEYNSNPRDIVVCICPSILKCCFEVDEDVVKDFKNNFNDIDEFIFKGDIVDNKQKYYIDTVSINVKEALELGILSENIETSNICTKCESNKYHSYRADHEKSGRNLAVICLK